MMTTTRILYHGTNVVVGLFTNETLAAKVARKATLRLANNITPLKQLITQSLTEKALDKAGPLHTLKNYLPPLPVGLPTDTLKLRLENSPLAKYNPTRFFRSY
jgi:hypothetical protein